MKSLTQNVSSLVGASLFVWFSLLAPRAGAAIYFWDPNGASAPTGGTWNTSTAQWATSTTLTASPVVWNTANLAVFTAGASLISSATITVNSAINTAGVYNGGTGGSLGVTTLTFSGTGSLGITGVQGFNTIGGATTTFSIPITDAPSQPAGTFQTAGTSSAQVFLNAANTFSGGFNVNSTLLVNFNNASSFGAGPINWNSGGSGGAFVAEGSSAITIPNNFVVNAAYGYNLAANAAGITYSGNWSLGANTISLGCGGGTGFLDTLSGVISGTGGFGRQTSTTHGTIKLTGANTYSGKTSLQSSVTSVSSINSVTTPAQQTTSNLGKPSSAANGTLGFGSTSFTGTLLYTGGGETTDRVIDLAGTTGGAIIQNDGSGALVFTSANTASVAGAKTLTLQGANTAANKISGAIVDSSSGATTLTKAQAGKWVLGGANTYSGNTTVSAGTLAQSAANVIPSGAGKGTFAVSSGATFDLGGFNCSINGFGTSAGTIDNTTGAGTYTLTIGNNNGAGTHSGVIKNTSGTLAVSKTGTGAISLTGANTYSGDTTISGGQINISGTSTLGDATGTLHLSGGALNTTATRTASTAPVANPIDLTADSSITTSSTAATVDLNLSSSTVGGSAGTLTFKSTSTGGFKPRFSGSGFTFSRPIVIDNGSGSTLLQSFNTTGTDQTFSGAISGSGGYSRTASTSGTGGRTVFSAAAGNSYGGGTTVGDGVLLVNNTTGSGTGSGAVTVSANGTLGGNGIISGAVTVNGTLAPGNSIGTLTLGASPTLSGTTVMEIDKTASPNADKVIVTGALSYTGGTLTVNNIGPALTGGENFDLFDATSFSGAFTSMTLPSLGMGLNWWTGRLTVDGTLYVNQAPTAVDKSYSRASGTNLKIAKADLLVGAADPDAGDGDSVSYDALVSTGTQGATVTQDATYIYYAPANNNSDTLQYRLKDNRGGTVTKNIAITVVNPGGLAQSIAWSPSGVNVTFAGIPGQSYEVQRAEDTGFTVNLTSMVITNAPGAGIFSIFDPAPPNPTGFYRTKQN